MSLPPLTRLQFALLDVLGAKRRSGRDVRDSLSHQHGIKKSLASFYMAMKRLEDCGFVEGRYVLTKVDGFTARERHYQLSGMGAEAFGATRDWYLARTDLPIEGVVN